MRLLLFSFLTAWAGSAAMGQSQQTNWFTSSFLGEMWRGEGPLSGDSSYVEPELRPLLPSMALEDLRHARHPQGTAIAGELARRTGLFRVTDNAPAPPIGTDSLLVLMSGTEGHAADMFAYARLRLFDHLVGDWSRTEDDIAWYPCTTDACTMWQPVPRPYENPFTRYDGLLPWMLLQAGEQMTSWSDDPSESLHPSNPLRQLDRRILSSAPWSVWDSAATSLSTGLTSDVLASSCEPASEPGRSALVAALTSRSGRIYALTQAYYRRITRFVEFHGNGHADSIFLRVLSRQAIEVSTRASGGTPRILNSLATREVRFLLTEGGHTLWVEGRPNVSFDLIADLGESSSSVFSRAHSLQAWQEGPTGGVDLYRTPADDLNLRRDDAWGQRIVFVPWLDANQEDHLFLGGGPEITTSAYRRWPYATRTAILAGFATRTRRYRVQGSFETRTLLQDLSVGLFAEYSQLSISNFYGLGNETISVDGLAARSYYKADQRVVELKTPVRYHASSALSVGITPALHILRTDPRAGSLLDSLISAGFARRLNYTSISIDASYDSRDRTAIPTSGMQASVRSTLFPASLQNRQAFTSVEAHARTYLYLGSEGMHLMLRTTAKKMIGDHPWFESAFVGGSQTLRGYERKRYAGDAAISGALESRVPLGRIHVLWPFDIGGVAFAETGRVFVAGEASARWHSSGGIGAWLRPARSPYTVVVSVAVSSEEAEFLATFGLPIEH